MTMAVASKVLEAEKNNLNDKLLGCSPGIQILGATSFDDLLSSIEVILAFAWQTGECIGLLGVTLEDITLDSPGDRDPSTGRDGQRAVAVVASEEPLQWDTGMSPAGSPRPDGSDWTAGLSSCVGEPLISRPPGYSLPPLQSFHDTFG